MPRSTQRDPDAIKWFGLFHVECLDKDGNVKWTDDCENALFDEGEFGILDIALRAGTAPANWYIGLMKNTLASIPAETSTLASLNTAGPYEIVAGTDTGYARAVIARDATASGWPTLVLASGDYQATSKQVSFTNSGGSAWSDVIRWMFLTTVASTGGDTTGKLFAIAQLSVDRTLQAGDTLNITYNLKLQ